MMLEGTLFYQGRVAAKNRDEAVRRIVDVLRQKGYTSVNEIKPYLCLVQPWPDMLWWEYVCAVEPIYNDQNKRTMR